MAACGKSNDDDTVVIQPLPVQEGTRLTQTIHQATIDTCNGSGMIESSGLDDNNNLILDEMEVDSVNVTCDVIVVVVEPPHEDDDSDYEDHEFKCHRHHHEHKCKRKHK